MENVDDRLDTKYRVKRLALRKSIEAYDRCETENADLHNAISDELANLLFMFVENRPRTQVSLLRHLDLETIVRLPDTSVPVAAAHPEDNLPLAAICMDPNKRIVFFVPRHGYEAAPLLTLNEWWEGVSVGYGKMLSRRDLVNIIRDKDGGGHVDAKVIDQTYLKLLAEGLPGNYFKETDIGIALFDQSGKLLHVTSEPVSANDASPPTLGEERQFVYGVFATVRQIAGELDFALACLDEVRDRSQLSDR